MTRKLEDSERQLKDGKPGSYPRIIRNSPEAKEIFKQMTESEFINMLDNVTTGKP